MTSSNSDPLPSPNLSIGSNFILDLKTTHAESAGCAHLITATSSSELLKIVHSGTSLTDGKVGIIRTRFLCWNEEIDVGERIDSRLLSNTNTPPITM
jgi:hypothetical protein